MAGVRSSRGRGGGVLAEKLGRGVRPASQNPYPIYDQICDFPYPIYEGGGHDKEVASSKKVHSRLQCKNRYPIYDQNGGKIAKIDTQFMTKTAEKPYPLGPHIPI